MKIVILPYGTAVIDSSGKFKQIFPTEEEAVTYIREQEQRKRLNGGDDDE